MHEFNGPSGGWSRPQAGSPARLAVERRWARILDEFGDRFHRLTGERPSRQRERVVVGDAATIAAALGEITQETLRTLAPGGAVPRLGWFQRKLVELPQRWIAARVLGLYVPRHQAPAAEGLYINAARIAEVSAATGIDVDRLSRFVGYHEAVHQWQFTAHPWLAGHLTRLQQAAARDFDPRAMLRSGGDVSKISPAAAELGAVQTLLEGYADFIAARIGRDIGFERIAAVMDANRSEPRSPLARLVLTITGMGAKMRRYAQGRRFCDAVDAAGGIALLQRVWESEATLPTDAEMRDPARWVARMSAGGASGSRAA